MVHRLHWYRLVHMLGDCALFTTHNLSISLIAGQVLACTHALIYIIHIDRGKMNTFADTDWYWQLNWQWTTLTDTYLTKLTCYWHRTVVKHYETKLTLTDIILTVADRGILPLKELHQSVKNMEVTEINWHSTDDHWPQDSTAKRTA